MVGFGLGVSVSDFLRLLWAVVRRRWLLILIPIVVFSCLSVAAAMYWPRVYIARTLIMLQEGQASDPLSGGGAAYRRAQLRVAELDTLIKSEDVLGSVVLDRNFGERQLTLKEISDQTDWLRDRIRIGVVGQEFIEIELRGSSPGGLANLSSTIVTRFLERLLAREDVTKTSRQFVLDSRKHTRELVIRSLGKWLERRREIIEAGPEMIDLGGIHKLQKLRSSAKTEMFVEAGRTLSGSPDFSIILAAVVRARQASTFGALRGSSATKRPGLEQLDQLLAKYEAVDNLLVSKLREALAAATTNLDSSDQPLIDAQKELFELAARYNSAIEQYGIHRAEARKSNARSQPPFGLVNPELIRIIDEPKDPQSPSNSILKIIVACLVAGVGLGAGVAALAEQFDDTLYDLEDLNRLSGAKVIVRLPRLENNLEEVIRPPPQPSS